MTANQPDAPNYSVSEGHTGGSRPIWWLGIDETQEHQVNLNRSQGSLNFAISSNGAFSVDELKHIAASL